MQTITRTLVIGLEWVWISLNTHIITDNHGVSNKLSKGTMRTLSPWFSGLSSYKLSSPNNKFLLSKLCPIWGPPIALFTYSPMEPIGGQNVELNASSSFDPDGTIVSYHWNFGDGTPIVEASPMTTHLFDCRKPHRSPNRYWWQGLYQFDSTLS